jgi:hypothetical protein
VKALAEFTEGRVGGEMAKLRVNEINDLETENGGFAMCATKKSNGISFVAVFSLYHMSNKKHINKPSCKKTDEN